MTTVQSFGRTLALLGFAGELRSAAGEALCPRPHPLPLFYRLTPCMRCCSLHARSRSFLWDRHFCQRSPPLHVQSFFVSDAFDGGSLREPRGGGARALPRTPSRFFKGSPPACAAARFTHKALSSLCFAGAFKVATNLSNVLPPQHQPTSGIKAESFLWDRHFC